MTHSAARTFTDAGVVWSSITGKEVEVSAALRQAGCVSESGEFVVLQLFGVMRWAIQIEFTARQNPTCAPGTVGT